MSKINFIMIKDKKIEIGKDLSEFLGIYLGDGYLNGKNYEISIVCGEIDKCYIKKYIPFLMKKLFGKRGKTSYLGKTKGIKARIYSKEKVNFLTKNFKLNTGKK